MLAVVVGTVVIAMVVLIIVVVVFSTALLLDTFAREVTWLKTCFGQAAREEITEDAVEETTNVGGEQEVNG